MVSSVPLSMEASGHETALGEILLGKGDSWVAMCLLCRFHPDSWLSLKQLQKVILHRSCQSVGFGVGQVGILFLVCLGSAKHGKFQTVCPYHPNHYHIAGIPWGILPDGLGSAIVLSDEPGSRGRLSQHSGLHLQNRSAVASQVLSKMCNSSNRNNIQHWNKANWSFGKWAMSLLIQCLLGTCFWRFLQPQTDNGGQCACRHMQAHPKVQCT